MASIRLQSAIAWLLCLPSLASTVALAAVYYGSDASQSPGRLRSLLEDTAPYLFLLATYGPVLLLAAIPIVLKLARAPDARPTAILAAWTAILLTTSAAIYFHAFSTWRLELP